MDEGQCGTILGEAGWRGCPEGSGPGDNPQCQCSRAKSPRTPPPSTQGGGLADPHPRAQTKEKVGRGLGGVGPAPPSLKQDAGTPRNHRQLQGPELAAVPMGQHCVRVLESLYLPLGLDASRDGGIATWLTT